MAKTKKAKAHERSSGVTKHSFMTKAKPAKTGKAKQKKQAKTKAKSLAAKSAGSFLVTKDMHINEIISRFPNTVEIFFKHGFYCVGCQAAAFESLEQGAKAHGMSDAELDEMVNEMNEAASREKDYRP